MSFARPASLSSKAKRGSLPSAVMRSPTVPWVMPCWRRMRVHARLQRAQFFLAAPMNLVRRHARGGARAQRPGVVLVAARQFPHAGVAGGAAAMRQRARRSGGRAPVPPCPPQSSRPARRSRPASRPCASRAKSPATSRRRFRRAPAAAGSASCRAGNSARSRSARRRSSAVSVSPSSWPA